MKQKTSILSMTMLFQRSSQWPVTNMVVENFSVALSSCISKLFATPEVQLQLLPPLRTHSREVQPGISQLLAGPKKNATAGEARGAP